MDENFSTPMMQQYMEIKKDYKDYLVFYRMGDFYELFLQDAEIGSQIMDVALTSRNKGSEGKIPMCGVPFHAIDTYLAKVIKAGHKAAICEQITKPQKNIKLVERKVVRIITPGTIIEQNLLDQKTNNYVLTIYQDALAYADISTGQFFTKFIIMDQLFDQIKKINPAEIVIDIKDYNDDIFLQKLSQLTPNITKFEFDDQNYPLIVKALCTEFEILRTETFDLDQNKDKKLIIVASNLIKYLKYIQKSDIKNFTKITKILDQKYVRFDIESIQNLEIFSSSKNYDTKNYSLFNTIDKTHTAMGARLLKDWLIKPLIEYTEINQRLEITQILANSHKNRQEIIDLLQQINDIPRLYAKLANGTGNARDLQNICISLTNSIVLADRINQLEKITGQGFKFEIDSNLKPCLNKILNSLTITPPFTVREGNMINPGVDERLDQINREIKSTKDWITNLEQQQRELTQIPNLKVGFNSVFGYYIEITKSYIQKVPTDYIRKQTLVNAERYITDELKQKEEIVLNAQSKINEIEFEIFNDLVSQLCKYTRQINDIVNKIATIDCLVAFALNASQNNWIKPTITDDYDLILKEAKHPVVEKTMEIGKFTPNDTTLSKNEFIHLITGPNMSGKSTYIRQVAIIQLLAQIGSFVPAQTAKLSIVDGIYTRIGSGDALAQGLSTFMVEMIETAKILNNATKNSLVILDEVGRGTSTIDGIAIAQAIVEHIHQNIKCKTLFATHLHELTNLSQRLKNLANYHIAVLESQTTIKFLHKIKTGSTDKSYGIDVAKLAGIPVTVIQRANEILNKNTTNQLKLDL